MSDEEDGSRLLLASHSLTLQANQESTCNIFNVTDGFAQDPTRIITIGHDSYLMPLAPELMREKVFEPIFCVWVSVHVSCQFPPRPWTATMLGANVNAWPYDDSTNSVRTLEHRPNPAVSREG